MILSPEDRIYTDLANAIVAQAAEDYRKALKGISYDHRKSPEKIIKEILRFFRSEWFRTLTKVDADYLIEQLNKEHKENVKKEKEKQSLKTIFLTYMNTNMKDCLDMSLYHRKKHIEVL
jgi:thiaminase